MLSDLCKFKQPNSAKSKTLSNEEKQYLQDSIVAITLLGERSCINGKKDHSHHYYKAVHVAFFKEKTYTDSVYQKILKTLNLKEEDIPHLRYLYDTFCKMFCASYFYYTDIWRGGATIFSLCSFLKLVIIRIYWEFDNPLFVIDVFRAIYEKLEKKLFSKGRDDLSKKEIDYCFKELGTEDCWNLYRENNIKKGEERLLPSPIWYFDEFFLSENKEYIPNEGQLSQGLCNEMLNTIDDSIDAPIQKLLQQEAQKEVFYDHVEAAAIASVGLGTVGFSALQFKNAKAKKDTSPKKYIIPATLCLTGLAAIGYAVKIVS